MKLYQKAILLVLGLFILFSAVSNGYKVFWLNWYSKLLYYSLLMSIIATVAYLFWKFNANKEDRVGRVIITTVIFTIFFNVFFRGAVNYWMVSLGDEEVIEVSTLVGKKEKYYSRSKVFRGYNYSLYYKNRYTDVTICGPENFLKRGDKLYVKVRKGLLNSLYYKEEY